MGSSRKHKKHKTDKSDSRSESEQKPLRLVLKVPQTVYTSQVASHTTIATTSGSQPSVDNYETPPKLMAFTSNSAQPSSSTTSSSVKKMKKKKSKKKHRKHSHHHSRHRHHSHHHRHRGSCSHHSRQSQDSNPHSTTVSTSSMVPIVSKSPQKCSSKSSTKSQFQQFLCHLLKQLQRKDIQQFFAWPVSDMIAPGYSSIISNPMDLSTIKQKIDQNQYENLFDIKADVKLMCDNAMKYNRPETVYYKAANKLWHYAKNKLFNKDSLMEVARTYPGLSSYELGFNIIDEPIISKNIEMEVINNVPEVQNTSMIIGETLPLVEDTQELREAEILDEDGMTPEQILEEAKKAAQMASDRLSFHRPQGSHLSFLRQRPDGSTTLSIVGNHHYESTINLESLAGKLTEGTSCLSAFKEAEINRVKPIESVSDAPFASYLPSLDSSRATLNEEESALLLSTYGDDEFGLKYAQSITQFAHEADYVLNLVDSLLDILTHGQHTKIAVKLREQQKSQETQSTNQNISNEVVENDTSMSEIQSQLNETGSLIGQLESLQYQRLSSSTQTVKPTLEEEKLANQLSSKLTNIIGNCSTPAQVSDVNTIRKAMGIKIKTEK